MKTRYVLTKKTSPDGKEIKFKARMVVQGFHQQYGRDFLETFSPVVGFDVLRTVIKMMVERRWNYSTMDFKQAYLNAPLNETIYVRTPDGSVSRLNKALYGLKQAGAEWNSTLTRHLLKRTTWKQSEYDGCLFIAWNKDRTRLAVIAVYVDDLFITGSWDEEMTAIKDHLLQEFEGKVDEEPKGYLGLQINRSRNQICIHQTEYCKNIVKSVFQTQTRDVHASRPRY